MSVSLSVDGPGDAELISAVRGGDVDAYGELFARHVDSARRLARQLAGHADADDLVSDAFTKVLTVLQRGGGPDLAFRAYLLTAVRRLHVDRIRAGSRLRPVDDLAPFDPGLPFQDTAVEGFDNAAAARAFASLPERWQMVLWHTEVEQQKPADIAPLLGMSANSVSALAYRAREGLRQAFLSQHATDPDDVDCAWTRDHLGAYVRGGLSRRDASRVDDHLASCRACAAVYLELTEVNSGLAGLLAPLLLGTAGASYLGSTGAGSSVFSTSFTAAKTWAAAHASVTAVGGMVVAGAAVLSVYGAAHLGGSHNAADVGSPPQLSHAPSSVGPSDGGNPNGHHGPKGSHHGRNEGPGRGPSFTPSSTPSAPLSSVPTGTDESTAPTVNPTEPTTGPTDPSTGPTDPTTGPTDPGGGDLAFTSTPPSKPAFGSTYEVTTSGGSGKVQFSIDPATTHEACSIAGHTVTFDHAGSCVIAAETGSDRAGGGKVTQSVDVPQEDQTVTITSKAPADPVFGQQYDVSATSDSGAPVTLSVDSTTNSLGQACRLDGSTVTFDHAGSCAITASAGNHDFRDATDAQIVDVAKQAQTVTITSNAPQDPAFGDDYVVTATSSSGAPVSLSVDSTTNSLGQACRLDGSDVTFQHAGSCAITASAGNDDYRNATDAQTVDVAKQAQTVTITSNAPQDPAFGDDYAVTATSSSGAPVSLSVDSTTNSLGQACRLDGSDVTFQHAGSCAITASAGNDDYRDATDAQTVDVAKQAQTVTITSNAPQDPAFGDDYAVTATSSSGAPVSLSVDPTTNSLGQACRLDGSDVTFQHAGSCAITASAGNDDYRDATDAQTVTVAKQAQKITFTSTAPTPGRVGVDYTVAATGGASGNPVSFTSGTSAVCTVSGATVKFVATGTCTVRADQAGNDDYSAAQRVTQDVKVERITSSLSVAASEQSGHFQWAGREWHGVNVTVTGLADGATGTLTSDADQGVVVVPFDLGTCFLPGTGTCHITRTPTTIFYLVGLPRETRDADVQFTVESDDTPGGPVTATTHVTVHGWDDEGHD